MKVVTKVLILALTCTILFAGGSIYSGLYAEYGHRGPKGEYLFNTGIAWSAGVSLVVTGLLGFLLFRKK